MNLRDRRFWDVMTGAVRCLERWTASFRRQRHYKRSFQSRRCGSELLESRVLLTSTPVAASLASPIVISGTTNHDIFTVTYSGNTAAAVATVRISTAGSAAQLVGSYPATIPLAFSGLWGADAVKIIGTGSKDQFRVGSVSIKINAAEITTNSIEYIELVGGRSDDIYAIDADSKLPKLFLDEAGGGIDTLDFSSTTTQNVFLDLRSSFHQTVNFNLAMQLRNPATIENVIGGSRNNSFIGNLNANVLVGGPGDDFLDGDSGNDLLIGGLGIDEAYGGANDDILISGRTTFDRNISALKQIMAEWNSAAAYNTRVSRLRSGVGAPLVALIRKSTVLDDTSLGEKFFGGTGQDWFFRSFYESVSDLVFGGEVFEIL